MRIGTRFVFEVMQATLTILRNFVPISFVFDGCVTTLATFVLRLFAVVAVFWDAVPVDVVLNVRTTIAAPSITPIWIISSGVTDITGVLSFVPNPTFTFTAITYSGHQRTPW